MSVTKSNIPDLYFPVIEHFNYINFDTDFQLTNNFNLLLSVIKSNIPNLYVPIITHNELYLFLNKYSAEFKIN